MTSAFSCNLFSLTGKTALVTGAASGIGKAVALLFARAGATLVLADSNLAGAEKLAAQLHAGGSSASALQFDLADEASIGTLFAEAAQRHGALDILVNNAGIYPKYTLESLTHEQWLGMNEVNVWGCFVCMREAAQLMRVGGNGGRIINVSSIGAVRTAMNHQIAYNASKAALDSMTLSAAHEYAPDRVLVNSVLPGAVRPLEPRLKAAGGPPASGPLQDAGRILLGRPAEPDEVAGPILMLASAAGAYITGQAIIIDGGFSIS